MGSGGSGGRWRGRARRGDRRGTAGGLSTGDEHPIRFMAGSLQGHQIGVFWDTETGKESLFSAFHGKIELHGNMDMDGELDDDR